MKLKIAMLGHKRIPSREGGVEVVVGELATRMCERGHEVTCYNRRGRHIGGVAATKKPLREYRGVILKNVWTLDKKGLAAVTASLSASVRAAFGKYDVVHFHAEGPCAMMWLPKLFGKTCIATIHGLDHQRAKWGKFASWYIRTGEKNAVRFSDRIIVLSPGVQQYFRDTYGIETTLIPNGVNRPAPREAREISERFGLDKDGYFLYLGRLVPEKGADDLIRAYRHVKTDKKLVIAGSASDSADYAESLYALAAGDERILFTGFVEGTLLEELYSNAYAFVLPSKLEGMPLSLLEAMSYGNYPLVSDLPECADVVGDCGLTHKKGDEADLAAKLQYLCDRPDVVRHYRSAAADYICEKYNWDDVTAQTLRLYGVTEAITPSAPTEEREYQGATDK